jgi:hypothetical protein
MEICLHNLTVCFLTVSVKSKFSCSVCYLVFLQYILKIVLEPESLGTQCATLLATSSPLRATLYCVTNQDLSHWSLLLVHKITLVLWVCRPIHH